MWLDGKLCPAEEVSSAVNGTTLFGDGAFETIRIHHGSPFRMRRHLHRLAKSVDVLGLSMPLGINEIVSASKSVVGACGKQEGLLRIVIAEKEGSGGAAHTVLSVRPLPMLPDKITLHMSQKYRRTAGALAGAKTLSRAVENAALREAHSCGAFDALLLDMNGHMAETTARNIFIVSRGALLTPPAEAILAGVTREAVIELAGMGQIAVEERHLDVNSLESADEVFLTGSGVGVAGVCKVDDSRVYAAPGHATSSLQQLYAELIDRESSWTV